MRNVARFAFPARTMLAAFALVAIVGVAQPALAQTDAPAGCTQANPCTWVVDVNAAGFDAQSMDLNVTQGDWYVISAFNGADAVHVVSLSGFSVSLKLASDESKQSAPVQFGATGTFSLVDQPSGDTLKVTVLAGDVVDNQNGLTAAATGATSAGMPSLGVGLLGITVLAFAAASRHK